MVSLITDFAPEFESDETKKQIIIWTGFVPANGAASAGLVNRGSIDIVRPWRT
jgi:hypothetical protein